MFEHYIFGTVAPTQQSLDADQEISPSDCSYPSPITPTEPIFAEHNSLTDIVSAFAEQNLLLDDDVENERSSRSFCEMSSDNEFCLEKITFVSTTRGMHVVSANVLPLASMSSNKGSCRRMKRQLDCQAMASEKHTRDIKELLLQMVETSSQCELRQSPSQTQLQSPPPSRGRDESAPEPMTNAEDSLIIDIDEDEGFAEMEDELWNLEEEMSLRRASGPSGIRKYAGGTLGWRRSTDYGTGISSNGTQQKRVRSVPRMRRRRPKSGLPV